jgi:hypothetical protein
MVYLWYTVSLIASTAHPPRLGPPQDLPHLVRLCRNAVIKMIRNHQIRRRIEMTEYQVVASSEEHTSHQASTLGSTSAKKEAVIRGIARLDTLGVKLAATLMVMQGWVVTPPPTVPVTARSDVEMKKIVKKMLKGDEEDEN